MVKIALVGYGHDGRAVGKTGEGNGYAYVVNDNVRIGNVINPISTAKKKDGTETKFATTGKVNKLYSGNTAKGQEQIQKAGNGSLDNITKLYKGNEVGASGDKKRDIQTANGNYVSEYELQARAGNMAEYKIANPNAKFSQNSKDTFEEYSKPYIPPKRSND